MQNHEKSGPVGVRGREPVPRDKSLAGRRVLLIDAENLAGALCASAEILGPVIRRWLSSVNYTSGDHVVVACHPVFAFDVRTALPFGQLLVRRGRDGADRALLDHVANYVRPLLARYSGGLVIGSGDHIFASVVDSLHLEGVPVRVVAPRSSTAKVLMQPGVCRDTSTHRALLAGAAV